MSTNHIQKEIDKINRRLDLIEEQMNHVSRFVDAHSFSEEVGRMMPISLDDIRKAREQYEATKNVENNDKPVIDIHFGSDDVYVEYLLDKYNKEKEVKQ